MIKQSSVMYPKIHKGKNVPRYEILSAWTVQYIFDINVVPMTTYNAKAVSLAVTIKKRWTNPSEVFWMRGVFPNVISDALG